MPIEGNQNAVAQPGPDTTIAGDAPPTGFLDGLMNMPGFAQWMQRMLEGLGYGVNQPGAAPLGTSALATKANQNVDPYGSNWAPGMVPPVQPKQPITVGDWKPPQAKPDIPPASF